MKTIMLLIRLFLPLSLCFSVTITFADDRQMGLCLCNPTNAGSLEKPHCATPASSSDADEIEESWPTTPSVYTTNLNTEDFPWITFIHNFSRREDKCPLYKEEMDQRIYFFDSPIRIGDDLYFNENPKHSGMSFCISSAPYNSYTTTFTLPEECEFNSATLQYWATGVWNDDFIYLNGVRVTEICHTGNIAKQGDVRVQGIDTCCTDNAIDISNLLRIGENTLKIKLSLYPWDDDGTPYDDIEIYDMHIIIDSAN